MSIAAIETNNTHQFESERDQEHTNTTLETKQRTPDANALKGLAGLRQRVIAAPAAAATPTSAPVVPSAPRRESNAELLHKARHAESARERDRAAEVLRRQIKTLCAAVVDRYTAALTSQEAEDLTQEVLVRLLTAAASAEEQGNVIEPTPAYIQRVAVNLIIDQRRRLDRRGLSKPGVSMDDAETALSVPDTQVNIEADVVGRFQEFQMRDALKKALSPTEAQVLWMRCDGASHAEIADALGIKEANARKHQERGLKRLRKLVDEGAFPTLAL